MCHYTHKLYIPFEVFDQSFLVNFFLSNIDLAKSTLLKHLKNILGKIFYVKTSKDLPCGGGIKRTRFFILAVTFQREMLSPLPIMFLNKNKYIDNFREGTFTGI